MLGLKAFDTYGLTEIIGPGIASECEEHNGLHISEDHFLVEVIDPVTMNPVKEGEEGELVFTTLSKEAFPLIRYRTRDIARLIKDQCPCGRSFVRMSRVSGRSDDMFFVSGVKLFPSQIREAISEIQELQPRCRLVLSGSEDEETLEIQVAMSDKVDTFDEIKNMEKLREGIKYRLETSLGISSKITFVEPESLDGIGEGKKSVKVERRQGLMP
jgi:phenylacetate-CoA ligase